jgi:hypothetical protein
MRTRILLATILAATLAAADVRANATIIIVNTNAPGVGFNDPTPRVPVGGNMGTTLGQQRLIAFQHAADKWGETLDSPIQIVVDGAFASQTCTATQAVLGAAGTTFIFRDFPQAGLAPGPVAADTWHSSALSDKRAGGELNPGFADIIARFNINLNGNPACLGGRQFYLGLDANHGTDIDLVAVLLHEFGHGLGFQQFASVSGPTAGARPQDRNDVFNLQIFDNTANKSWPQMTNAERAASAINPRNVVFQGAEVAAAIPSVLTPGTPLLTVTSPPSVAGVKSVGTADFGAPLSSPGVTGFIVEGLDPADGAGPLTTDGCSPFTNAAAVSGKIALVSRGTCGFVIKAKNAQNAGAIATLIADNVAGGPPPGMTGVDATVVIPSVRITLADGNALRAALAGGPINATLGVNLAVFSGADANGFALLFSPNPVQPGSTISHWDTIASRNQLMEPAINGDLTHSVQPPEDLTLPLMRDIGWFPDTDVDGLANSFDACPASNFEDTVSIDGNDTGVQNVLFTSGCTISDLVANVAAGAGNHGGFVSGMNSLLKALEDAGIITKNERKRMHGAAAHADLP